MAISLEEEVHVYQVRCFQKSTYQRLLYFAILMWYQGTVHLFAKS